MGTTRGKERKKLLVLILSLGFLKTLRQSLRILNV